MRRGLAFVIVLFLGSITVYSIIPTRPDPEVYASLEKLLVEFGPRIDNPNFCIVIDYDLPIIKKRLWVIDRRTGRVVINSHVSHALKSGLLFANNLSNVAESDRSCIGPFVTGVSYRGRYGYSMKLRGLKLGVNDNAWSRKIVFHSSIKPWSRGCFTTWPATNRRIIDLTKNGAFFYVHGS